jgi:predicted transcriptional regulator
MRYDRNVTRIKMIDIASAPHHIQNLKVFSIHTPYVDLIREGVKKYELRSYATGVLPGDWCIVYETSPAQHIATVFKASGYWCLAPDAAWERYGKHLGIDQEGYERYFMGKRAAFGIEIEEVRSFKPIKISELREAFRFSPPQGIVRWGRDRIHKRLLNAVMD